MTHKLGFMLVMALLLAGVGMTQSCHRKCRAKGAG